MITKQELCTTFDGILNLIDQTSGKAGLDALHNLSIPEFITWYENNIQHCSPEDKILGEAVINELKGALGELRHRGRITQEYLKEYAINCTPINPSEESISLVFAGAMKYASFVFGNHLVLGGAYKETKDYQEILEHLRAICKILDC